MNKPHISILGGGPAGLGVAYYAKKASLPFTLYEASSSLGGNARTLSHNGFLFDTGAHRWHDKFPDITADMLELMGSNITKIHVPSQIFYNGRYIDFPLSPFNLIANLGLGKCMRAGFELAGAMLNKSKPNDGSFESFALQTYGRTIAEVFLLNYSEKLWGRPCRLLSPSISGKRLKGLNLSTFLKEVFHGSKAKTEHLDGAFYYPVYGIGMIADEIAKFCGPDLMQTNSRITRLFHDGKRIHTLEINGDAKIKVEEIASTLPLPLLLQLLDPAPEKDVLELSRSLSFRNLILVGVFLNRYLITPNASVYFPTKDFMFSRIYEPKNRSAKMAPQGKTSLLAEIPCSPGDDIWNLKDEDVTKIVCDQLSKIGWVKESELIDTSIHRFPYAYPILEMGFEEKVSKIFDSLRRFENLKLSGRSGEFKYIHIHDLMKMGKNLVNEFLSEAADLEPLMV
ncbi:MAG TPA: FAD-dependent oxidoreductase [bacterium]|nr:FAD-dependent oxidoreductase [bacterium]